MAQREMAQSKMAQRKTLEAAPMIPQNDGAKNEEHADGEIRSSDDPIGTRIIFVVVAMVVLMFIIALGFLFEVARHRPA